MQPAGPSCRPMRGASIDHTMGFLQVGQCRRAFQPVWRRSRSPACGRTVVVQAAGRTWETGCRLAGVGSSVPAGVLTNADLEQLVETNDEWIASRTGIRQGPRSTSITGSIAEHI
jgi:hypothetical protein